MNYKKPIQTNVMHDAALHYAEVCKWPVFPLVTNKKVPDLPTGFKAASLDAAEIEKWWARDNMRNIGIPTGPKSGIFVIDLDEKDGVSGSNSLTKLEAKYGALPPTRRCKTGSGGQHIYFHYPKSVTVKNRVAVFPGIDVRGEGGYVVAPPSVVDGKRYEWIDDGVEIADAPEWLLELITAKPSGKTKARSDGTASVIHAGGRNDQIFRFVVGQMRSGYSREKVEGIALQIVSPGVVYEM